MVFTEEDKAWLDKCKNNPDEYCIMVDNDMIFVVREDDDEMEDIYTFSQFGYDFAYGLLDYLGCTVEYV